MLSVKPLLIYGDGLQERDWLFVEDYRRAIALALEKAKPGSIYNVSAGTPQPSLKIAKTILHHLGKPESLMRSVQDRPGHDRHYASDCSKNENWVGGQRWTSRTEFAERSNGTRPTASGSSMRDRVSIGTTMSDTIRGGQKHSVSKP